MTRARAIATHCKECSGGSPKEVTLCHLSDCPLWVYRCGDHIRTKAYKERMGNALKAYAKDIKTLVEMGIHIDFKA